MTTHHASKTKGLLWLSGACLLGAIFAFGLSPLARAIPWSWEKRLSRAFDLDFSTQECKYTPQAHQLLQRLVKRIYPVGSEDSLFSIDVRIVKDSTVNAYAALGGKITINSGLLKQAESPEEVAGVLAHEVEHVHHRHIMEGTIAHLLTVEGINTIFGGYSSAGEWTNYFLNMNFTRSQEAQADEEGLKRLQTAQIDNQGFKHFFERMEQLQSVPAFLSDHSSNSARSEMAGKFDNHDAKPIMTADEWKILKNYCD